MVSFPCSVCEKPVAINHEAVCCDKCDKWVHIRCNNICKKTYRTLKKDPTPWFCKLCLRAEVPFSELNNTEFARLIKDRTIIHKKQIEESTLLEKLNQFSENENLTCKYYNTKQLKDLISENNNSKGLTLLHMNISSLPYHFDEFTTLLSELNTNFKVIGITETRLTTKKDPVNSIEIENYNIEHTPTKSDKGGALLYISKEIDYKTRDDLKIYKEKLLESVFIEILAGSNKNTIIGCIYKHPGLTTQDFTFDFIQPLIDKIAIENKNIVLLGDFNVDLLHYESNNPTREFLDLMFSASLIPQITIPTRLTVRSKTLIDNIFTTSIDENSISGNLESCISDHYAQFLIFPSLRSFNQNNIKKHTRSYKNLDSKKFKEELRSIKWATALANVNNDVNESLKKFLNLTNRLIDKYAPMKQVTKKQMKTQSKPWITKGILTSIRKKDKIHKKSLKAKDQGRKEALNQEYKIYKNLLTNITRKSKENYYKQYFKDNKNNLIKVWKGIKEIILIKKTNKSQINCLKIGEEYSTDSKKIAKHFNKYFGTIAKNIDKKTPKSKKKFSDYLKNQNVTSFLLSPVTEKEISNLIVSLNARKATGPNSIPNFILKEFKEELKVPLTIITNMSFVTGQFPQKAKEAYIIPVYKKGDKLEKSNYRPISLLPNISKLIEKAMYTRLYKFLEKYKYLYKKQFGFRNSHSTNHALISITEKIRESLDKNEYSCGVFLDFQKAFDTVNHEILIKKLHHYGIRGITNQWFKSYLTNRTQKTKVNDCISEEIEITYGVPQGSILGPLLFLVYINDMHEAVTHSLIHHFADDTNILYCNKSLKKINKYINHDLSQIVQWLRANRISLNANKTELIIFRPKNKNITKQLNFRISGQKINTVNKTKYLGIYLDQHLTWNFQLNQIKTKLSRSCGLLAKLRYHVKTELLRTVYFAIFDSILRYAVQVWGQCRNQAVKEIEKLQNKAIRIMSFKGRNEPTNPLYKNLEIMKLKDILLYYNCLFAYDQINENLPENFKDFFLLTETQHNYNTRGTANKTILKTTINSTTYGLNSVKYRAATEWNKLSKHLNTEDKSQVIESLKEQIFNSYN